MPGTPYNAEIIVLEVAFDIAVVKVVDDWLGERYTDYLDAQARRQMEHSQQGLHGASADVNQDKQQQRNAPSDL